MKLICIFLLSLSASLQAATYGQKVVAAVLMAEAWGEGTQAMTAVAEVIRIRADREGVSPLTIVTRPKHFSCLNAKRPEQLVARFQHEPDFQKALRIARQMYNTPEQLPGHAKQATHFANKDCSPYWAKGKEPVALIGKLAFYRL